MRKFHVLRITLISSLLWGILAPAQVSRAAAPTNDPITWQIVERGVDHLRVDIHIHDDAPMLNGRGVLFGVPSLDGLALHVLDQEMTTLPPSPPATPTPTAPVENLLGDGADLIAPAIPPRQDATAPIEIAESGMLRDQPYVLLRVYPRQYDPAQDRDRFYSFLQVELRWQAQERQSAFAARAAGGPFEAVLAQTLYNYADLGRPQTPLTPEAPIVNPLAYWPSLKIAVVDDGLYQMTWAELVAAGVDFTDVDPANLRLTLDGDQVPLWLEDGGDGVFGDGDWLRFYGVGRNDLYTAANVYVLNHGDTPGLRMDTRELTANPAAPLALDFPNALLFEVNNHYWQTMPNGAGQDHWFWGGLINAGASLTVTLDVPHVAPTPHDVTMHVRLRGRTTAAVTPNHHTQIYLNEVLVDGQTWSGQIPFTHTVTFSHTLLTSGDNSLRILNVGDTEADADIVLLNRATLDYRRTFTAADGELVMTPTPGAQQFDVAGFANADLMLLDISNPAAPVRLLGAQTVAVPAGEDGGGYSLRFADTVPSGARYLSLSSVALRQPAWTSIDVATTWRSPLNAADAILITHADFVTATRRLADFHRNRGLRTVVVDVEDIYDEFSHSRFTPEAIRDFIAYAYAEWQAPAPTYVTLIGDATIDYRDYLGTGTRNFVPAALTQTRFMGDTPTDNWFVAVSGDDPLPDLFIGRLSVEDAAQADAVINKVIGYAPPLEPATGRGLLMVADDDSPVFPVSIQQLAETLPSGLVVDTVDAAAFPPGDPQRTILDALVQGRSFVHYSGHGTVFEWGTWGEKRLLSYKDTAELPAGAPLFLMTVANCLNGFFTGVGASVSLAEAFQRQPESGAVAVWAPTGLSFPAGHLELMKAFYRALLGDAAPGETATLGAAAAAAKITVYTQGVFWTDLVETYTLFGDPSQRLVLPGYPYRHYLPQVQGSAGAPDAAQLKAVDHD